MLTNDNVSFEQPDPEKQGYYIRPIKRPLNLHFMKWGGGGGGGGALFRALIVVTQPLPKNNIKVNGYSFRESNSFFFFFFFFFASLLSRDGGQLLKEVQCPKEHIPSFKSRLHIKELHNISHLDKVMQKLS